MEILCSLGNPVRRKLQAGVHSFILIVVFFFQIYFEIVFFFLKITFKYISLIR